MSDDSKGLFSCNNNSDRTVSKTRPGDTTSKQESNQKQDGETVHSNTKPHRGRGRKRRDRRRQHGRRRDQRKQRKDGSSSFVPGHDPDDARPLHTYLDDDQPVPEEAMIRHHPCFDDMKWLLDEIAINFPHDIRLTDQFWTDPDQFDRPEQDHYGGQAYIKHHAYKGPHPDADQLHSPLLFVRLAYNYNLRDCFRILLHEFGHALEGNDRCTYPCFEQSYQFSYGIDRWFSGVQDGRYSAFRKQSPPSLFTKVLQKEATPMINGAHYFWNHRPNPDCNRNDLWRMVLSDFRSFFWFFMRGPITNRSRGGSGFPYELLLDHCRESFYEILSTDRRNVQPNYKSLFRTIARWPCPDAFENFLLRNAGYDLRVLESF